MNHDLVRLLAQFLVYFLIILLPVLAALFTERFRRQPDPGQYAVLFALAAVMGVLLFLPAVAIIAGTALVALGIAWLTARSAPAEVTAAIGLSPDRLFPGDEAELAIAVENRKPLPLAWLSITAPIRHGLVRPGKDLFDHLAFSGGIELLDDLGTALVIRTAIAPFQRLTRTYRVTARRRGVYSLGPARLEAGDPFGMFRRDMQAGRRLEIIVYPRVYDPGTIGLPFRQAMGSASAPRALLEDPILLAGSREYRPGDPLHRMHWKATARTGELQVRTADPSTTAEVLLLLNLNTFQHVWQGVDLDRMEATIEVAASVGLWLLERDFPVGVRSNGILPGVENTPRLAPSAHPRQAVQLLEHLARLAFSGRFAPETVLEEEARRLPAGTSILFVTSIITPSLIAALSAPRLSGRVSVVYCGRFAAPVVRGVPIHLVVPPREVPSVA